MFLLWASDMGSYSYTLHVSVNLLYKVLAFASSSALGWLPRILRTPLCLLSLHWYVAGFELELSYIIVILLPVTKRVVLWHCNIYSFFSCMYWGTFFPKMRSTLSERMDAKVHVRSKIRISFLINVMGHYNHYKSDVAISENCHQ